MIKFRNLSKLPLLAWIIYLVFAGFMDKIWIKIAYEYYLNGMPIETIGMGSILFIFFTILTNILALLSLVIIPYKIKILVHQVKGERSFMKNISWYSFKKPHTIKGYVGCIIGIFLVVFFIYSVIVAGENYTWLNIIGNIVIIAFIWYQIYKRML